MASSARDRLWRLEGPRARTIAQAARFIDQVGFAVLFPHASAPSLWGATAEHPETGFVDFDDEAQRVWAWKDELPLRRLAWYGPVPGGRKMFLSVEMLRALYPGAGKKDDHRALDVSPEARALADVLLSSGPTSQAALREATHLDGKKGAAVFTRAKGELGRHYLLTHHGVEEQGAGWPSAVFDLTARAFPLGKRAPLEQRRIAVAARYLATMGEATPARLARTFGWKTADARAALDAVSPTTTPVRSARRR